MSDGPATPRIPTWRVALAWGVHAYTGLGLVAAAWMTNILLQPDPAVDDFRVCFLLMFVATFIDATRLKGNQKVRIAGVPVGAVKDVKLNPNNTVDVAFTVDKRYTLYSSTRALIRYDNLVGDRFLGLLLRADE